jgi:uncharacterized RDD family membrane protein YckC
MDVMLYAFALTAIRDEFHLRSAAAGAMASAALLAPAFGAMLAVLFPAAIRATAPGLCYNVGRAASVLAPFTIGALADRFGIGSALAVTSAFFVAGVALIFLLPEAAGQSLSPGKGVSC